MAVKLHRVGFCLTAAVLLLALFLFSASYLLALLGVLLGLALALALLLRRDARRFSLQLHAAPTGQVEHPLDEHPFYRADTPGTTYAVPLQTDRIRKGSLCQ